MSEASGWTYKLAEFIITSSLLAIAIAWILYSGFSVLLVGWCYSNPQRSFLFCFSLTAHSTDLYLFLFGMGFFLALFWGCISRFAVRRYQRLPGSPLGVSDEQLHAVTQAIEGGFVRNCTASRGWFWTNTPSSHTTSTTQPSCLLSLSPTCSVFASDSAQRTYE